MSRFFSKSIKSLLYIRQDGHCAICGTELKGEFHADHIHPYSKGGRTTIENCQLLCPKCNLSKGDKVMSEEQEINLELREWQEEAYNLFSKTYSNKEKFTFLVTAFPGAGKTKFTIACMYKVKLIENNKVIFVIFSPRIGIQSNWADTTFEVTNGDIDISKDIDTFIINDFDGVSETYAIIPTRTKTFIEKFESAKLRGYKIIAILDEVHHLSKFNSWGNYAKEAFDLIDFFICLSGTPTRKDKTPIPFLDYEISGKVISDYSYTYAQAIKDKVCRAIIFHNQDGELTYRYFEENSKIIIQDFDEYSEENNLTHTDIMELFGNAENPSKPLIDMINECSDNLDMIRSSEQADAGCIVFCMDIEHAKSIKLLIEKETGDIVDIVTSENSKESIKILNNFKNTDTKWIVSVGMISEGVDITRARCVLWLSNIASYPYFIQAIGRVIRHQSHIEGSQYAYVYIPKIPILSSYAKKIMDDAIEGGNDKEKKWPPEPRPWPAQPPKQSKDLELLDSKSLGVGYTYHGEEYSKELLDKYEINLKNNAPDLYEIYMSIYKMIWRK